MGFPFVHCLYIRKKFGSRLIDFCRFLYPILNLCPADFPFFCMMLHLMCSFSFYPFLHVRTYNFLNYMECLVFRLLLFIICRTVFKLLNLTNVHNTL